MLHDLNQEVLKLKSKNGVDKRTVDIFLKRLTENDKLTKYVNPEDHFCVIFVPFDVGRESIYMGHHIKADDWIPPGGHIREGETPIQSIKREFSEELGVVLKKEKIVLFDLSIKDVSGNPKHTCKIHYDLWYLVHTPKINFDFIKTEFYAAGWFTVKDGLKKIRTKPYRNIIRKLSVSKID